jgi:diguanylate cyclase (GGDEF)-like protein
MKMKWLYPAALLLWLVLCALIGVAFASRAVHQAESELDRLSSRLADEISQRLNTNEAQLDSYAGFSTYALHQSTLTEQGLLLRQFKRHPAIVMGLRVRRVAASERAVFERELSVQRGRPVSIHGYDPGRRPPRYPLADHQDYYPVASMVSAGELPPLFSPALGMDVVQIDFLRDALLQSRRLELPALSRPFAQADGHLAYLMIRPADEVVLQPVPMLQANRQFVALVLRVDTLLPRLQELPSGMRVQLWHQRYGQQDPRGRFLDTGRVTRSPLETLLFPRLELTRSSGGSTPSLMLNVSWQLGWAQIGLFEWLVMALLVLMLLAALLFGVNTLLRCYVDRVAREQELFYLANHDALTGLANRNLFEDRLQHAINRVRRNGKRLALLFLDMDRFKPVNDTYGHAAGDRVLQLIAARLNVVLRGEDTVARLGGDEFVVLIEDVEDDADVERVRQRLQLALQEPYEIDGGTVVSLGVSIGTAFHPDDGVLIEDLLGTADRTMYRAKQQAAER